MSSLCRTITRAPPKRVVNSSRSPPQPSLPQDHLHLVGTVGRLGLVWLTDTWQISLPMENAVARLVIIPEPRRRKTTYQRQSPQN